MGIVDTPEKDVPHIDNKLDKRKLFISSIKASSKLFSGSMNGVYNIVHFSKTNVSFWSHVLLGLKTFLKIVNEMLLPECRLPEG